MCRVKKVDGKIVSQDHRQLTSDFIAYKLSNSISSLPTMSIKSVQDHVKALFHYNVKHGKACKAKQAAYKMLYGDWEEAYNRLPRLLGVMASVTHAWFMWSNRMGKKQGFTLEGMSRYLVMHFGYSSNT